MQKNRILKFLIILLMITTFLASIKSVNADDLYDDNIFTLQDQDGNQLMQMARKMFNGDEYISSDNKHYVIDTVDGFTATGIYKGDVELPDFELIEKTAYFSLGSVSPIQYTSFEEDELEEIPDGKILIYCTHTDESYVPSDGVESEENGGGILDVAQTLKDSIENNGGTCVLDKTNHFPHDSGAYSRSRETAMQLIKENSPIAAVFDIHRDAVPADEYATEVDGEQSTMIRIVIGNKNQNSQVNKELALKIKAICDETHPGLIKDIYMGKGEYNQELSPRSLLFEVGSHENKKEEAQQAVTILGEVLSKAIYGGSFEKSQDDDSDEENTDDGTTDNQDNDSEDQDPESYRVEPINKEDGKASSKGILWIVGIAVAAAIAFIFISMGKRERKAKMSGWFKEEFNDVFHKNKRDK